MKGSETKLIAFMQGSDKRFVIPVYQRNYDWKTENCKQLFDDLKKVIKMQRKSHFFGSIVSVFNPDGENMEFQIIDGQQRLTTISLLLLAMYNLMKNGIMVPEQGNLADKIFRTYLIDEWQDDDTRIKLKPVKNDQTAFGKLFDEESEHIKDSNVTINYRYFYDRIQRQELTMDELFEAIRRLEIINITLNQDDNPQLIFESLNSTGVALSEGDKIRNFILMGLPTKQQNNFYEKYWNKIEVCTGYEVSAFVRDYLSVKQQSTPALNKIYFTFKAYVEEANIETEPLLADLLSYAKLYEILLRGKTANKRLNACIDRLNRLESTVTRPFFLEVLRLFKENKLTIEDTASIFLATENYLFRRTMCELPTNALNKIFLMLHKEIVRYDGTEENYLEKFKFALLTKRERARFPGDKEFADAMETRQVYQMTAKNKLYILERFENAGTNEDKDVYRHLEDGTYSIEHIMPQHLTPAWVKDLGEDYLQIHSTWLHRMANLTLTAYNSKYSNSPFAEKKTMKDGYLQSGIRMNQRIAQKETWGLAELEERSRDLVEQALVIWETPVTSFKPVEKQLDSCTLDDDVNLSGRLIARFTFKNTEQPVTSWIDMFERVVRILHAEDQSVLSKLAYANAEDVDLAAYVSTNKAELRGYSEIEEGLYFEKNTSTWMKISVLRRLFKLYNVDPMDLVFYLRDESESADDTEINEKQLIRKKYWAFALEQIHAAHGDNGSFSNVNPSVQSWISGYFGVSGFSITCTTSNHFIGVEIYFGKANRDQNKEAFDYLATYRTEIENKLGVPLTWSRGEDTKSSKVCYRLTDVSIENEEDWPRMAKFHTEWSKKFFDVIVPYLRAKYLNTV